MVTTPDKGYILLDSRKVKGYDYNLTIDENTPFYMNKQEAESKKKYGLLLLLLSLESVDKVSLTQGGRWYIKKNTILNISANGQTGQIGGAITKTLNQRIFDAYVMHQISLMTYAQGMANRFKTALDSTKESIQNLITSRFYDFKGIGVKGDVEKFDKLVDDIFAIREKVIKDFDLEKQIKEIIPAESKWYSDFWEKHSPYRISGLVLPTALKPIIEQPFLGNPLSGWVDDLLSTDKKTIQNTVSIASIEESSVMGLVDAITGIESPINTKTGSQIDGLTRTAVNATAHETRNWIDTHNPTQLIHKEMFVATLDNRTTPICTSLDGHIFDVGSGRYPPIHWRCRSKRIPIVAKDRKVSLDLNPELEEEFIAQYENTDKAIPFNEFASKKFKGYVGDKPQEQIYSKWLSGLSKEAQNEILGEANGAKFRNGKLNVDRFIPNGGFDLSMQDLISREKAFW